MRKTRRLSYCCPYFSPWAGWLTRSLKRSPQTQREIKKNPIMAVDYLPESALHVKDFHRAKIENGRKVWELIGDEADYYKDQKEAVIKRPRFLYYDQEGEAAETSGEVAKIFLNEKELERLEIQGGIRVNYQNYVLKSAEAIYLPGSSISLPKRTTLVGEGFELEGASMEVELESKIIRMLHNVKTKIEPDKLEKKKKNPKAMAVSGG